MLLICIVYKITTLRMSCHWNSMNGIDVNEIDCVNLRTPISIVSVCRFLD